MANVTQQIPNFLGGVSRLPDFNKQPGQVIDITNGNPDLTYGLLKRPGTTYNFTKALSQPVDEYCFHILDREGDPRFLIAIHSNDLRIYNIDSGSTYLPGSGINVEDVGGYNAITDGLYYDSNKGIDRKHQFAFASDDQRTVIVNKTMVTQSDPTTHNDNGRDPRFYPADRNYRTVSSINELPDTSVKEFYNLKAYSYDDNIVDDSGFREGWHMISTLPYDTRGSSRSDRKEFGYGFVMHGYILNNGVISNGGFTSGVPDPIPNIAAGGYNYYNNEKLTFSGPNGMFGSVQIKTGIDVARVYHITGPTGNQNNTDKRDDYYMSPFSESYDPSNPSGAKTIRSFYWVESPRWDTSIGLNASTLPQELVYDSAADEFEFRRIDYSNRWSGDGFSNPDPSFIGSTINNVFFHNNRLGFLSRDNIVLSRPIYYVDESSRPEDNPNDALPDPNPLVYRNPREIDFFLKSCIQVNDADPIDIKAGNNNISNFHKAISTPQGVIVFSDGQQSLLSSQDGSPLTPANADISGLGVFEVDPNVDPVSLNSDYYFIDQNASAGKLFRMTTAGYQQKPDSIDVSTTVHNWIPANIDYLSVCQTPGFVVLTQRGNNLMYIYKTEGEYQAWVKWEMPNDIVHVYSKHEDLYVFMRSTTNNLTIAKLDTNLLTTLNADETNFINKYLDYNFKAGSLSVGGGNTTTALPAGYPNLSGRRLLAYVTEDNSPETYGWFVVGSISGSNAVFPGDLRGYNGNITVGYDYDFEIELPQFFFQSQQGPDYTAYLTIARIKFAVGLTGDFDFLVSKGGKEWTAAYTTTTESGFAYAGEYKANYSPIINERIVTVPIHERNTQFRLKLTSNSPYPLALDSCMWEGNYSPRYYGRS